MKKFIAGLVIGLMFTSTVSFAANQDISAVLTDFNFIVNGQAKALSTRPIVYNGTSYLPVREISNLLGYDVSYSDETRTITLTTQAKPDLISSDENTTDLTDLIYSRDLYDHYGVEISNVDGLNPVTLEYNGRTYITDDFVIIDARMYFHKDILEKLGIN